jgi:hypothetical protein
MQVMEFLKECLYDSKINSLMELANFIESEYVNLLSQEVMINESTETMLTSILNDAERRINAAKRGLSIASKIKDPLTRKQHVSKIMGHLNRSRSLLDKVVKEFFPENGNTASVNTPTIKDEFISPQQAADTLGIPTYKLQNYVVTKQLHMYNDGGKWALKGSEVQQLANRLQQKQ